MIVKEKLDKLLYKVTNPTRYIGGEWNQIKKEWKDISIKVALAFPDLYEIGMSHLGLKILYHILNNEKDILCERVYAPWTDMEELMRSESLPLFSLENKHEIRDFDILGFTLQYEMSYTNILNMIDLAGLPLYSKDRDEGYPLIIAGGSTVYNPEPLALFIDLFYIGEAEEGIVKLVRNYDLLKEKGLTKEEILCNLSQLPGVYVPRFYNVNYCKTGKIESISPTHKRIKDKINRQIIKNLDQSYYPTAFIVPYMRIVHDRAGVEIARGCSRGCRFCAAGISYRPVRERREETIIKLADEILANTGYEEISLTSLSTADYSNIEDLIKNLAKRYEDKKISISLPSLRVDQFSVKLAEEVQRVRKSGLTFAPEAGTQRLRDVINKGVNEDDLFASVRSAFEAGWSTIKLYFMIGLPTETDEDVRGIVELAKQVLAIGKRIRAKQKKRMRPILIHVSVSTFIPKPFTPFQWVKMVGKEEIINKQKYLRDNLRGRGLNFSWNEPELSLLEGVFSRGDRRLTSVLEAAWQKGCRFDGWNEQFDFSLWEAAFKEKGIVIEEYLDEKDMDEILPWEHINMGVSNNFLKKEYRKALQEELTEDCRGGKCTGCGICFNLEVKPQIIGGEVDVAKNKIY